MHKIAKQLGLRPLDTVRLLDIDAKIKSKGYMNIDSFRELLMFCPGITTQLRMVTGLHPQDMYKVKADIETYNEMMSEYKERIGIKLW